MKAFILITGLAISILSNAQTTRIMTADEVAKFYSKVKADDGKTHVTYTWEGKTYKIDSDKFSRMVDSVRKIPNDTIKARFIKCLNAYRASLHLSPVVEYKLASDAAKFITDYNLKLPGNQLTHKTNIPGYYNYSERHDKIIKLPSGKGGETLVKSPGGITFLYSMYVLNISLEQTILNSWIKSPGHNAILTIKDADYVGFNISEYKTIASAIVFEAYEAY
jgi:hypothetical protein